jgi:hypothetical protein
MRFRRWRATHVLNLAAEHEDRIHGTLLLALGDRETSLRNIVGGGYFDEDDVWHTTGVDRGLFQFNEEYHEAWLKSVPGCLSGEYAEGFSVEQGGAFPRGRVPGLSSGALHCIDVLNGNFRQVKMAGVPDEVIVEVGLCGYNAGIQRCIQAYKAGRDPNLLTTHGDYGKDVLVRQKAIRRWLKRKGWS